MLFLLRRKGRKTNYFKKLSKMIIFDKITIKLRERKMRFVITGGTGHIGNNLIRKINQKFPEVEVLAFVRRENPKELVGAKYTPVLQELNKENFEKLIEKEDIVVHLAGVIDLKNNKKELTYNINFLLAKDVADVCLEKGVKRFVYVGSVDAIYREGDGEIKEPEKYYPDKMEGNYGITKALASEYVLNLIENNLDFNAVMVLPTAVIGVNDYKPSAAGKIILDTLRGKAELGIKGGYNFVDVEDVANAILTLCQTENRGQYILSGNNVSVKELYGKINDYKGLKKKPIIIPTWIARLACPFVNVLNKITLKALLDSHNYSCQRASEDFGYKPTEVDKTVQKTIDWFEENQEKFKK